MLQSPPFLSMELCRMKLGSLSSAEDAPSSPRGTGNGAAKMRAAPSSGRRCLGLTLRLLALIVGLAGLPTAVAEINNQFSASNYMICMHNEGFAHFTRHMLDLGHDALSPEMDCCTAVHNLNMSHPCLRDNHMSEVHDVLRLMAPKMAQPNPDIKKLAHDNIHYCDSSGTYPFWSTEDRGEMSRCLALMEVYGGMGTLAIKATGNCLKPGTVDLDPNMYSLWARRFNRLKNTTTNVALSSELNGFSANYNYLPLTSQDVVAISKKPATICPRFEDQFLRGNDQFGMEMFWTSSGFRTRNDFSENRTFETGNPKHPILSCVKVLCGSYSFDPNVATALCPDPMSRSSCFSKGMDYFLDTYETLLDMFLVGLITEDCLKTTNCVPRIPGTWSQCVDCLTPPKYPLAAFGSATSKMFKKARHNELSTSVMVPGGLLKLVKGVPNFMDFYGLVTMEPENVTSSALEEPPLVTSSGSRHQGFLKLLISVAYTVVSTIADNVQLRPMTGFFNPYKPPSTMDPSSIKSEIISLVSGRREIHRVDETCNSTVIDCVEVASTEVQCIQMMKSGKDWTAILSEESVCDGRLCASTSLSGLIPSDFMIGNPPDTTIFVPDGEGNEVVGSSEVKDCVGQFRGYVVPIKLTGQCTLDASDTKRGLLFTIRSIRYTHLMYTINNGPEVRRWMKPLEVLEVLAPGGEDFSASLKLVCNGHGVDEKFIVDKKEWCEKHSYMFFTSYYCKHSNLIWWCLLFLGVGLMLHVGGAFAVEILSFISTIVSYGTVTSIMVLMGRSCCNCGQKCVRGLSHECSLSCYFCGAILASTSESNKHFEKCKQNNFKNRWGLNLKSALSLMIKFKIVYSWLSQRSKLIIFLIVIFTLMDTVHANPSVKKTMISDLRVDLTKFGAHSEQVPSNLDNMQSMAVAMTGKTETCDAGSCIVKGSILLTIKAIAGSSYRLKVTDSSNSEINNDLVVIIEDAGIDYPIKNLYKACDSEVLVGKHWECQGSCAESDKQAKENLCKLMNKNTCDGLKNWKEGASTWGCEPAGCIVALGGCASSYCVERAKPDSCVDVVQLGVGKAWIKVCFFFLGNYECTIFGDSETRSTKSLSMTLSTQNQQENDKKLVITRTNQVLEGEINGLSEFSPKFGYPQFDVNDPQYGNCGYGTRGGLIFDCSTASTFSLDYCCQNTFSLKNHLNPRSDLVVINGKISKRTENVGVAIMTMELQGLISKTIKIGQVSSFRLTTGKGCYKCDTGFIVTASCVVNLRGVYKLDCSPSLTTISNVYLQPGQNSFVFSSTAQEATMTLKCSLNGFESSATFNLDKKTFAFDKPSSRNVISLDDSRGNFMAWLEDMFDPFSWGIGSVLRKALMLGIVALAIGFCYLTFTTVLPNLKNLWYESRVQKQSGTRVDIQTKRKAK